MRLTVFAIGLLAISTVSAEKESKEEAADSKDKREAPVSHYMSSAGPHASHTSHKLQIPSRSHGSSNAISIGAGYSIGGGKHGGYSGGHSGAAPASSYKLSSHQQGGSHQGPTHQYVAASSHQQGGSHQGPVHQYQAASSHQQGGSHQGPAHQYQAASSHQQSGGHHVPAPQFQLPNGQVFPSLEKLMQNLRESGLHVGTPTQGGEPAAPALSYGSPHSSQGAIALASFGGHQAFAIPQASYGATKLAPVTLQLTQQQHSAVPSYAAGSQGLGAYASSSLSSTSPQLFSPAQSSGSFSGSSQSYAPVAVAVSHAPALTYGAPSSGHSFGDATQSLGDLGHSFGAADGHSFGGAGHSFGGAGGHSFSGAGHSFGGPGGPSFGGAGHSFGGSGQSFGGHLISQQGLSGFYGAPSVASFKPSAFLGASVQESHGDSYPSSFGHGGGISAESLSGSGGHGAAFSSGKFSGQAYLPPSSFGGHSFGGLQSAFSGGHSSSPPGTSYGIPSGSYGMPANAHVSPSNNYYQISSKYPSASYGSPSFGHGSSAYSSPSSHGSLGSLGSSHGYQQSLSSSYGAPDSDGDHSETSYNTIKYSSNLSPKKNP